MKKILIICSLCIIGVNAYAQEETQKVDLGADLVSRYVWRGMAISTSPAVQPFLEFYLGNFTVGTWGSYSLSQEPEQEVDLYLSYSLNSFTLTLNDYFIADEAGIFDTEYFEWNNDSTTHALEAILSWQGEEIPIGVTTGLFFYGADKDEEGNNNYSTYLEVNYTANLGNITLSPFLGITLNEGMYNDGFGLVNLGLNGSKELQITDNFSIPLNLSFVTNPAAGDVFLVFSMSF